VPEELPTISRAMLIQWRHHSFPQICAEILHLFSDIPLAELNQMTETAYGQFNGGLSPLPMTQIENNLIFLDASYGPTLAFKDIGQQIVAQLLNYYLLRKGTTAKIIVETSGLVLRVN
jgi:threonine synthase